MEVKSSAGFRGLADEVRARPLVEVAPLLGYRQDRTDRSRWRGEGSVISVTGAKYYDHLQGCGGVGAIDLVIHARRCTPAEAIRWLAGAPLASASAGMPSPGRFVPPPSCERSWMQVRDWLTGARNLEGWCVDALRARGWVYADARGNAVFLCRDARGDLTDEEAAQIESICEEVFSDGDG